MRKPILFLIGLLAFVGLYLLSASTEEAAVASFFGLFTADSLETWGWGLFWAGTAPALLLLLGGIATKIITINIKPKRRSRSCR
jgi:hypothetical protein